MSQTGPIDNNERMRTALFGISGAAIAILLFVSLVIIKPAMPDRIVLLTGPDNSAYHDLGKRYAEDLRSRGLEVQVIVTEGALDNVRQIVEGRNAVAFAPSTVDWVSEAGVDISPIVALGSIGFEPLWLFHRSDLGISRVSDLAGRNVVTEGPGTASHHVARVLLEKNGLTSQVQIQPVAKQTTAEELIESFATKNIDAIFTTGDSVSPFVRAMLNADGVQFLSFERADAYAAQIPGIAALVAPEGVFDLAHNVPRQDAKLLAYTTCLIAHKSLHPAVAPMLLVTAENIRQKSTTLPTTVAFPSDEYVTLPLDTAARRYFNQGEIGLSKSLPYRITRFANHLGFFVLPLLTAAVVLLKAIPICLRIWTNVRLKRMFKRLEVIEKRHAAGDDSSNLLAELDRIGRASATMFIPLSSSQNYVDFRQFIHDMRERIE